MYHVFNDVQQENFYVNQQNLVSSYYLLIVIDM